MLPGERLAILVIILLISFIADAIIFYVLGYKSGRRDEGEEWVEKKEYYEWLLQMKKRQDFEEVRFADEKPKKKKMSKTERLSAGDFDGDVLHKKVKPKLHCDICGRVIKKGTLCYDCQKAGW